MTSPLNYIVIVRAIGRVLLKRTSTEIQLKFYKVMALLALLDNERIVGSCGESRVWLQKLNVFKSDVRLTVHRNSVWIRKTN